MAIKTKRSKVPFPNPTSSEQKRQNRVALRKRLAKTERIRRPDPETPATDAEWEAANERWTLTPVGFELTDKQTYATATEEILAACSKIQAENEERRWSLTNLGLQLSAKGGDV